MNNKQKGLLMDQWMTFETAWRTFFSLPQRKAQPSEDDFSVARSVCEELMQTRFAIRSDGEIFHSEDHMVHINPGFLSAKIPAAGLVPDSTYAKFTHRYEFTTFVSPPPPSDPKVLCPEYNVRVNPEVECGYCGGTHSADGYAPQRVWPKR